MSCGFLFPSQSEVASLYGVAVADEEPSAHGHEVLIFLIEDILDDDDALALHDAAEGDDAGDGGEDGRGLGLARLEELADARQAARDVHGLGALLERLGQGASRLDELAVLDVEVGAAGQEVGHGLVARLVGDDYARLLGVALGGELRDLLLDVARLLVDLLLEGGSGDDVLVADVAVVLGDDRVGEGVEGGQRAVGRDDVARVHDDLGAVAHVDLLVLRDEEDRPAPVLESGITLA